MGLYIQLFVLCCLHLFAIVLSNILSYLIIYMKNTDFTKIHPFAPMQSW